MALHIKPLNADSTFLLTFSPTPPLQPDQTPPGSFAILVDPWLHGEAVILSSKLSHQEHSPCADGTKIPSTLTDLSVAPRLDLVLISQDKPDHCHRSTLCTLPQTSPPGTLCTPIVAPVSAAKRIRSWNHFAKAEQIVPVRRFRRCANAVARQGRCSHFQADVAENPDRTLEITTPAGVLTIAYLVSRRDPTAMHTAMGIVYWPNVSPSSSSSSGCTTAPLSLLYAPHGVPTPIAEAWARACLPPPSTNKCSAATPQVTALIHSFNEIRGPWYFGTPTYVLGGPGGVDLCTALNPRVWVSGRDGGKELRGVLTKGIRVVPFGIEELTEKVSSAVKERRDAHDGSPGSMSGTALMKLGVCEGRWVVAE